METVQKVLIMHSGIEITLKQNLQIIQSCQQINGKLENKQEFYYQEETSTTPK
jgi:hypothetical protein